MDKNTRRVRLGCYASNISMSVVGNLSPLLFLTFNELYGISFGLLGLLVLINFCTQLTIDLIFSFFSHKFNIPLAVKCAPFLTMVGLVIFGLSPVIFPNAVYVGLCIGTVLFSMASGFCEVLISPVIAALPSDDPDRDMSKLHSIYAWGVVAVAVISTVFLYFCGRENWQILPFVFLIIPIAAVVFFAKAKLPEMATPEKTSGAVKFLKNGGVWLCVLGIFLGGAAEVTMAQWASSYIEQALSLPKIWGDIFGVAIFAVTLGFGRSLYAKIGKNISRALFWGALGATACYLIAAISPIPVVGLIACALTGFCVSMMWPGSLIVASDRYPAGGVMIFALMAAGGDFGASVGPQLVGVVTDAALENPALLSMAERLSLQPEQFGMKLGMIIGMMFPLIAIAVYATYLKSYKKKN
jgi:MFS family permease